MPRISPLAMVASFAILVACADSPTTPTPSPVPAPEPPPVPAPPPAPEPEVVIATVEWPRPCFEYPESPCPSPPEPWSVSSHDESVPLCESMWIEHYNGAISDYTPQVAVSKDVSLPVLVESQTASVVLWFHLPFQGHDPLTGAPTNERPSDSPEGFQHTEDGWVRVPATTIGERRAWPNDTRQFVANVFDGDYGFPEYWPDQWGRPEFMYSVPPKVPLAVEMRRSLDGPRLDAELLCAGSQFTRRYCKAIGGSAAGCDG